MRCPSLDELPVPPPGRKGWPWTEESPRIADTGRGEVSWPLVSIVTPSFNQGKFLEETIRSVLLQGYPNLEYIIFDGGSTDCSVEIIQKYEKWITFWKSEPDDGQSHAINKGFSRTKGEILAWLNSDDTYEPGALGLVAGSLQSHQEYDVAYGHARITDEHSGTIREIRAVPYHRMALLYGVSNFHQASVFWRRKLFFDVGMVNEKLDFMMDYNLLLKFAKANAKFLFLRKPLSTFRFHRDSKTIKGDPRFLSESVATYADIAQIKFPSWRFSFWNRLFYLRHICMLVCQGDLGYILKGALRRVSKSL